MTTKSISRHARLYFQPGGFIASPFGHEGSVARLAGGLQWFTGYAVIVVDGGCRADVRWLPLAETDAFLASLSGEQAEAADRTIAHIMAPRPALRLAGSPVPLDQPQVMAILNMTPDSFSDGGRHLNDPTAAAASAAAMVAAGAAIVDVGGESTRPGAETVAEREEIARIEPVVRALARQGIAVSIDTRKAGVMAAALEAGAAIVNDVSALSYDPASAALLAGGECPVILMHHQGDPATMQQRPAYEDALIEVYDWLAERIAFAEAAGIARSRIVVDPGIGFGKALRHNLQLLNGLALFHGLGCPILLGASRKRIIGALSNEAPTGQRLGGSIALALHGAQAGVQLLRVHDVPETVQALRISRGLRDEALTPLL